MYKGWFAFGVAVLLTAVSGTAAAQSTNQQDIVVPNGDVAREPVPAVANHDPNELPAASSTHRMFGILPNYATVERNAPSHEFTARDMMRATAKNSFDPYVFPFVGAAVALGQGGSASYGCRYATAFADNAIGNFMTSALVPAVLHQDPRYYQRGTGGFGARAMYAVTRTIVTRSSSGKAQFNYSDIAGNLGASAIANVYYASANRSATATLTRWGTQVMWDALSNELKEFWPDIRKRIRSPRRSAAD